MKIPKLLSRLIVPLSCLISFCELQGQVGNDNPTGPGGAFNGNVTTGCSYDPYTSNSTRTITDISVAGAVGEYGLSYSRTWNSRTPGWRSSFNWTIEDVSTWHQDMHYTVGFPDGRTETFVFSNADPYFRAAPGVRERLQPWTTSNNSTGFCYLVLPDGGKVEFLGTRTHQFDSELLPHTWDEYKFVATAIIDPYGLRTTFTYESDGSFKATEPAQRWIKIHPPVSNVQVLEASDGREIRYTYQQQTFGTSPYTVLTSVAYYGDTSLTASYTYATPNVGSPNGTPVLASCDDPMYPGAMKKITYEYATANNPDGTPAVYGQILSEKGGDPLQAVSTLTVNDATTRTETRGDGKTRTFTYADGVLTDVTDFNGISQQQSPDGAGYLAAVTDRRGYTTDLTNNPLNGAVTEIKYPLTPPDTKRATAKYQFGYTGCPDTHNQDANNPYYLYSVTNELEKTITYTRDSKKRITNIQYPDGASEEFTYDDVHGFNQVLTHKLKSGGVESFTYDSRGLRQTYQNAEPSTVNLNPTARYKYDPLDRVSDITDARGASFGDLNYTTSYSYNSRGQIKEVTHPVDALTGARYRMVQTYNPDGTLARTTDAFGTSDSDPNHTTFYGYDLFKRVTSVLSPPAGADDTKPRTTFFSYDHTGAGLAEDYTHADSNVWRITTPRGIRSDFVYDNNMRKTSQTAASETDDVAVTSFTYDDVGNLKTVQDPNAQTGGPNPGVLTTYVYDERNRPTSVLDAMGKTTAFTYDLAGNKVSMSRPNGQNVTYDSYDAMNRLLQKTEPRDATHADVSVMTYDFSGNLKTFKDPRLKVYTYTYDFLSRRTQLEYPPDGAKAPRTEKYHFDFAGNMDTYTNRTEKVQTFAYDNLNRSTAFSWNDGLTPGCNMTYDRNSNLLEIKTTENNIVDYAYDFRNRVKSETQTAATGVAKTVGYTYDADGNRETMSWPGSPLTYIYNKREELYTVGWPGILATYTNFPAGNRKQRVLANNTKTVTDLPDNLNRARAVKIQTTAGANLGQFNYQFDSVGNIDWVKRDAFAVNPLGDRYGYDWDGQLTSSRFNALNADTTPSGWSNSTTFVYDAAGNRESVTNSNAAKPSYTYAVNNLNQYTGVNDQTLPTPTATPTAAPVATPTATATATPTATATATGTATATPTATPPQKVAMPTFSPDDGMIYFTTGSKTIAVATETGGCNIRYTINGAPPTSSIGTLIAGSSGNVSLTPAPGGTTLRAIAYKSGSIDSDVHVATFYYGDSSSPTPTATATATPTATPTATSTAAPAATATATATPTATPMQQLAKPTFNPIGGSSTSQAPRTVTISAAPGSTVYYTKNGSVPTPNNGTPLAPGGTVSVTPTYDGTSLRAIAHKDGMIDSQFGEAVFLYTGGAGGGEPDPAGTTPSAAILPPDGGPERPPEEGPAAPSPTTPTYNDNGDLETYNGWTYFYDAQNRLTSATRGGDIWVSYTYDGLNRQVSRSVNGTTTYNTWDGWNLIAEWSATYALNYTYVYGAGGELILRSAPGDNNIWYYHDANGNVTHLANNSGTIIERYQYDHAQGGTPTIYDGNGTQIAASAANLNNRFLFAGYDYSKETGLYDCRNRFYHPGLGRFLQPDPIGFAGDPNNIYRYCGNNAVNSSDPLGLVTPGTKQQNDGHDGEAGEATTAPVNVDTTPPAEPPNFGGTNNRYGFRDVKSLGGLDNLSQGGGRNSGGAVWIMPSRNSNGLGVSRADVPQSTQGSWTDSEGLPIGTSWEISDGQITKELQLLYMKKLRGVDVANMSGEEYIELMFRLDTKYFFDYANRQFYYVGGVYGSAGLYYGGEINYIGVGEGFAARGMSRSDIADGISLWKAWNHNNSSGTVRGSELRWATVGYFAYPFYNMYYH
jgi:RHS repeat-associated protein